MRAQSIRLFILTKTVFKGFPMDQEASSSGKNKRRLRLAVVIVNYRTAQLVEDGLASLEGQLEPGRDLAVVVENGSGDDSGDQLEKRIRARGWEPWVLLHRWDTNEGFAGGTNVGIRAVDADFYLLFNSDALARPGLVEALMKVMRDRPDVGLVGPQITWLDGTPQNTCYRFRTPITELLAAARTDPLTQLFPDHEGTLPVFHEPMEPDWLSFACALIRREVIDQVGLLDGGYFMYFDDLDYCRRAKQKGWKVLYWPHIQAIHLRGQSSPVKKLQAERKRRPRYFYASRARYFAKFYGLPGLWLTNLLWEVGRFVAWMRELVGHKKPHTCQREPLDIWTNGFHPLRMPVLETKRGAR